MARIPRFASTVLFLLVFSSNPAIALTFNVDSTTDAVDASIGDGICDIGGGICTLRAAIQEANSDIGSDTINIPAGTHTLSIAGASEDIAATGDLDITQDLVITGTAGAIVDGAALDRVFHIIAGNISISDLTITNGSLTDDSGAGMRVNDSAIVTLTGLTVSNSHVTRTGTLLTDYSLGELTDPAAIGTPTGGRMHRQLGGSHPGAIVA